MARKALSETRKAQLRREELDSAMARAMHRYQAEQARPGHEKKAGLRTICRQVEKEWYLEKHQKITLNHNTLRNLANGGRMRSESNADKSWLKKEEATEVIKFAVEMGDWGWGFSHQRLKEHVDAIVRARMGSKFPENGVGHRWTGRFIEKHSDQLHMYVARPLSTDRGQAVNKNANTKYFDMVEDLHLHGDEGEPVAAECIFTLDEAGFQANGNEGFERVIGAKGKKVQYQQQKGTRENITVIVTICANGTALPPAIIFKGKGYLVKWHQENPAKASLGYSQKGWTNRIIGLEYAKFFEKQTRAAAKGRTRVLYVDGHDSHLTFEFIQFCREHKIRVPSYPSHGTHVYQTLDVGIFSPLKFEYGKQRDAHLRETGEAVTKENFLKIYGGAHLKVLTPEIIKAAFRKVGIYPFNRNVITPEMMAPSRDTSYKVFTPVVPPTPVRIVSDLLVDATQPAIRTHNEPTKSTVMDLPSQPIRIAIPQLASSDARYLTTTSPIKSSSQPPDLPTFNLSPIKYQPTKQNVDGTKQQERRALNQEVLMAKDAQINLLKGQLLQLQATMVLQRLYCARVRRQLAAKEAKKDKQGKTGGRLLGDGLPHLLTDDEFYEKIKAHWEGVEAAEMDREARKQQKCDYASKLEKWQKNEEARKERNTKLDDLRKHVVGDWETRKAEAKANGTKLKDWIAANPRPKATDPEFRHEKQEPRPTLPKGRKDTTEESDGELFDEVEESDDEE